MKKSEAVQIIEDTIHDTYDYDPDLGWTFDAEAILDKLLEVGMLPPYRVFIHRQEWEPEDD